MTRITAWFAVVAMLAAAPAFAAPNHHEQAQQSPFPPNQPVRPYVMSGGTNETQGAVLSGGYAPNAGQTGLYGSGGQMTGFHGQVAGQRPGG